MCQLLSIIVQELSPLFTKPPFVVPRKSKIAPFVLRQRMSARPSPLKSPTPATCQLGSTIIQELPPLLTTPPFAAPEKSKIAPLSLRQRMSLRPSPLKSPVPATCQLLSTLTQELSPLLTMPPFVDPRKSKIAPFVFRKRISLCPSPLKSL